MRLRAWAALACVLFSVLSAQAGPVTLTANRGAFAISGELVRFDGQYYEVQTDHGMVTLRAEAVVCAGDGCLPSGVTTGFGLAVSHDLATVLVPALLRAFAADQGYLIEVRSDGSDQTFLFNRLGQVSSSFPVRLREMSSSEAFAELAARSSDFAIVDRSISPTELAILRDAGLGDMEQPAHEALLALDGLLVAVSPQRPESSVSLAAVSEALSKQDVSLRDFGLISDAPASVTLRAQSEDLPRLTEWVGPIAAAIEYRLDAAAVSQSLRADPERIGFLPASARGSARALELTEVCGLSHAPNTAQLATGRYPWMLPVKSYLPGARAPEELGLFVEFLESESADRVIRRAGFARPTTAVVPSDLPDRTFSALRLAAPEDLPALQALVSRLSEAEPMGLSIPASVETGPMRGLRRLATQQLLQGLKLGRVRSDRLLFLSSAASDEEAKQNVAALLSELGDLAPELSEDLRKVQVAFDGALLPSACPDAPWSDWMNARVDVWLLPEPREFPRNEN